MAIGGTIPPPGTGTGTGPRLGWRWGWRVLAFVLCLAAPAVHADGPMALRAFSTASGEQAPAPWHFASLPGKTPTRFEVVQLGGQRVLKVEADQSYGNLVHRTLVPLLGQPTLSWRWRVDRFVEGADLRTRAGDDGAAKLCVFFNLPAERLPFGARARLALARSASGEEVPSEVLCYVWDGKEPRDTLLVNAFTDRMRMMVLESGATPAAGGWTGEHRDLLADYRRAFGQEAGGIVPDVVAIAVSADADNTRGHGLAYFSDIDLRAGGIARTAAAPAPPAVPSAAPE